MPTSDEPLLLDTSAAVALLDPNHVAHQAVRQAVRGRRLGLAGHAEFETYSVLTRLPAPKRVSRAAASGLIRTVFPHTRHLSPEASSGIIERCAGQGIGGGAVYDALVAAAAAEHRLSLLSCDVRAASVYRALDVQVDWVR
ncbi:MAG: PIN domain-containing protein [Micropruina sp.]|uniref:PIN domain-containing protein n=1 Tax=Micropruina sp. TaxID=2737536 RepID=UPI0039E3EF09